MSFAVVDTDVASAVLKGQLPDDLAAQLEGRQLAITFVTVGELTQWTHLRRWGPDRRAGLRAFLRSVVLLPASFHAASIWGDIQAAARLRGRARPVNDSWVAACCIARDLPLATLNTKDYADFAEHEGLELIH
ncbi:MAG: PIN domain-containing protein [Pseudonocardia sp.]|nr:PIN domain-containing protein [Pseudonocardia sp.]